PVPTPERATLTPNDLHHWCNFCGYSSSYKGNVVRHIKLIHRDLVAAGLINAVMHSAPLDASQMKALRPASAREIRPSSTEPKEDPNPARSASAPIALHSNRSSSELNQESGQQLP